MKRICLMYRHPIREFYSIEKVFSAIIPGIEEEFEVRQAVAPSTGASPASLLKNVLFARRQKADLYHITGDVHYLALALPRRQTILTIHDCVFMHQSKGLKRWMLKLLFLDLPVRWARIVTTISESTKTDIIKYTGCKADKVIVIPNPLSETITFKQKPQQNIPPVLLFIGTTENKNLVRTISALEGLPCLLHIIGKVPLATKELLDKKLHWKNSMYLNEAELAAAYDESDLVLFPSLFEGFGLPIIEGQKAGRTVVTSNLSPMIETAGDGACFVNPLDTNSIRDGVLKVLNNARYSAELKEAGFINIEKYRRESIAARYIELYKSMPGQGGNN